MVTHHGLGFSNEEELSESTMERKEDRDAGGVLNQTALHSSKELPQWPQKCKVTTPVLTHKNLNVRSLHSKWLYHYSYLNYKAISFAQFIFPLRWAGGHLHGLFLNLTPQVHVSISLIHALSADDDVTVSKHHRNHANLPDM